MQKPLEESTRRAPIFGALSVSAPFVAVGVGWAANKLYPVLYPGPHGEMDLAELGFVFVPAFFCILVGIILSAVSAGRHEKWPVLGFIGFLLNTGVIVIPMIVSKIWPNL